MLPPGRVTGELPDEIPEKGDDPHDVEQRTPERRSSEPACKRRVDPTAQLPAPDRAGEDRPPQPGGQQTKPIVGDVGDRVTVETLRAPQLFERAIEVLERLGMLADKSLQLVEVAAVELHQAAASEPRKDQLEVSRAHRKDGKQRQTGAEVDRNQSAVGVLVGVGSLETVGLALAGGPLVLPRELGRTHLVEQADELPHEGPLRAVLR